MNTNELKHIKRRLDAATPGPWYSGLVGIFSESTGNYIATDCKNEPIRREDRVFIARARQDIENLLAHISDIESRY